MEFETSVVIPTLNRSSCLLATVHDFLNTTQTPLEIIIVDQSDQVNDKIRQLILERPRSDLIAIRYFHVKFRGLPRARNFGWQVASGRQIIFVDDDIVLYKNFVAEHLQTLARAEAGIVAGGIDEVNKKDNPNPCRTGRINFWLATAYRDFNSHIEQEVDHAPGGNFSVKREVLKVCRGFDESLGKGAGLFEESDFCLRAKKAGFKIIFNPKARIKHLAHPSGGCRVLDISEYTKSLARNLTIFIIRHLRLYHFPTAFLRLGIYLISYSISSRSFMTLVKGTVGLFWGLYDFSREPLVSKPEDSVIGASISS